MANYKPIGVPFDRTFRNDLNDNFKTLDGVASSAKADTQVAKQAATSAAQSAQQAQAQASSAKQASELAVSKADETQSQLDDIVLENGQSDAEVVQARGGEDLLYKRLNKTDALIAENSRGIDVEAAWGITPNQDETSKLQSKIDTLPNNTTLIFPGKEYTLSGLTFSNKKNITISGNFTKIKNGNNLINTLRFFDCENITVQGFDVECTWNSFSDQYKGQFIYGENLKNFRVIGNRVKRGGITVIGGENVMIEGNTITDTQKVNYYGIAVRNVAGVSIRGNFIKNVKFDGIKVSLPLNSPSKNSIHALISENHISECEKDCIDVFSGGFKSIITNNFLSFSEKGVHAKAWGGEEADYSSFEDYAHQIIISGNQIHDMFHQCVWIGSNDVLVKNNILTNSVTGVYIMGKSSSPVKNIVIEGAVIKDITGRGIESEEYTEEVLISNCLIEKVDGYGIYLRSNGVTVVNTVLNDVGTRGLQISSVVQNKNKVVLNGVQIVNKNRIVTDIGIKLASNIHTGSLVSNCFTDGIITPLSDDSGKVRTANNSWNEISQPKSEIVTMDRLLSESGIQTVPVNTNSRIKKITVSGVVQNTNKTTNGYYLDGGGSNAVYGIQDSKTFTNTQTYPIAFADTLSNRVWGRIQNVKLKSFDVEWISNGSGVTGTAKMTYIVEFY